MFLLVLLKTGCECEKRSHEKISSQHWHRLPKEMVESLSLEVQELWRYGTEGHGLVSMAGMGQCLDLVILVIFSSLSDPMVL